MSNFQQQPPTHPQGQPPSWPPQGQPPLGSPQQVLPPKTPGDQAPWWKSRIIIGGAALVLGVTIGAAGGGSGTDSAASASSTPTVTVSVPAEAAGPAPAEVTVTAPAPPAKTVQVPGPVKTVTAPPPGPAVAIPEDGTWLVGTDIKPGTYRSSDGDCYWARLKDTSGDFDAIIANGNGGNQVVTVKKTDKAFESARCAPWTKVR